MLFNVKKTIMSISFNVTFLIKTVTFSKFEFKYILHFSMKKSQCFAKVRIGDYTSVILTDSTHDILCTA